MNISEEYLNYVTTYFVDLGFVGYVELNELSEFVKLWDLQLLCKTIILRNFLNKKIIIFPWECRYALGTCLVE